MSDKVLSMYCFLDDYLASTHQKKRSIGCKCSDSLILTTALVSALYFGGNQQMAMKYMAEKEQVRMLEKSAFNRRLHRLSFVLEGLFYYLAEHFKKCNIKGEYVIDSFPVAVCDNIRIKRSKIVRGEVFRGKIASKKRYFYGFRVQIVTTWTGAPVQFCILPGAYADVTADLNVEEGSQVYGDAGYTDYEMEDFYRESEGIDLKIQRKKNSLRPDPVWVAFYKKKIRQKIEQVFSQITARFPKKIHAITQEGFLIKILLFILIFALQKAI